MRRLPDELRTASTYPTRLLLWLMAVAWFLLLAASSADLYRASVLVALVPASSKEFWALLDLLAALLPAVCIRRGRAPLLAARMYVFCWWLFVAAISFLLDHTMVQWGTCAVLAVAAGWVFVRALLDHPGRAYAA